MYNYVIIKTIQRKNSVCVHLTVQRLLFHCYVLLLPKHTVKEAEETHHHVIFNGGEDQIFSEALSELLLITAKPTP